MRPTASTLAVILVIAGFNPPAAVLRHELRAARLGMRTTQALKSSAGADTQRLVIQSMDGRSVRSIPVVGESNHVPMWSADGKSLAFQVVENGHLVLATVRSDGDAPRVFHDAISAKSQSFKWSPDSRSIGFLDPERHQFRLLSIGTGSVRPISVDSTAQIGNWIWRPDGRSIAAVMTIPGSSPGLRFLRRRLDEITLDGTQRVLLDTALVGSAPGVTFVDAYTIFVRDGTAAYRIPLGGGAAHRLVGDLAGSVLPSTGVHATARSSEVWAGLINRTGTEVGQIEFISARTGERRVVDVPFRFPLGASPEWTPDGRGLIVVGKPPGEKALRIYRIPVTGAEPSIIATIGEHTDGWTSVSPDGKFVVYGVFGNH